MFDCTYTWESLTADFCECPNCQNKDIVVLNVQDINNEEFMEELS